MLKMHHKNLYFAFITGSDQSWKSRILPCCTRITQLQTIHHREPEWHQHSVYHNMREVFFLYLFRGNQKKYLLTKQSCLQGAGKKICGWLSNAASAGTKVAKWRWNLTAVKGRRGGLVSAVVMTNFLCSEPSEVSHEPPQWEECMTGSMENPPKMGEPVVLTSVWSLGPAACLALWLRGCRPESHAGLTVFFSGCCSGLSSLRLLADC